MTRGVAAVLTVLALLVAAPSVRAAEIYFGGGILTNSFSADLKPGKWFEMSKRSGIGLNLGFRMTRTLAIDATLGSFTMRDDMSGRDAKYLQLEGGPVFLFNVDSNLRPYLEAGVGTYSIDLGDLEYTGSGGYVGAGIEEYSGFKHSVKLYARGKYWKGDPFEMDAAVLSFGLIYNYHLGGRGWGASQGRRIETFE